MNARHQTVQDKFLEILLQKFPKKTTAVETIAELLSIGKDAVYRRLRGDSMLTPEELKILAVQYRISVDEILFEQSDKVFFSFSSFSSPIDHFDTYLKELLNTLNQNKDLPGLHAIYTTAEIPMFYYGLFPELMCFKLYTWGKSVWKLPFLENEKFSLDLYSANTIKLIEKVSRIFMNIKSTEFWCLNILDNSLHQIEFLLNNGDFEKEEDALMLCDTLTKLTDHVSMMAKNGKKIIPNTDPELSKVPFELYHNELVFTNNTILMKSDVGNAVFSTFDSPNFLTTSDKRVVNHIDEWIQGIQYKSEYISIVSEKNRNQLFNHLRKKIDKVKKRIFLTIEV